MLRFDEVIILHAGQFVYNGAVSDLRKYLASVNKPCPPEFNIADHVTFLNSLYRGCEIASLNSEARIYRYAMVLFLKQNIVCLKFFYSITTSVK